MSRPLAPCARTGQAFAVPDERGVRGVRVDGGRRHACQRRGAACVVGVAVREHDVLDLVDAPAELLHGGPERERRSGQPGVNEGDLTLLEQDERVHSTPGHDIDVLGTPRPAHEGRA